VGHERHVPLGQQRAISQQIVDGAVQAYDARVADVGCGGGLLSETLAQAGARVTGVTTDAGTATSGVTSAVTNSLNSAVTGVAAGATTATQGLTGTVTGVVGGAGYGRCRRSSSSSACACGERGCVQCTA